MTKTKSKLLAVTLAWALAVAAVFPATAFAATPINPSAALTSLTIKGVAVTDLGTPDAVSADDAIHGSVALTQALLDATSTSLTVSAITADSADVITVKYGADVSSAVAYASGAVVDGGVFLIEIITDSASEEAYYVIDVKLDSGAGATGATGRDSRTLEGDSTVESVTIDVVVPTSIEYALDPLDLDEEEGQVQEVDLYMANKTAAPVLVTVDVEAKPTNGAILVDDPSELDPANKAADVPKKIYFGLLGAKSSDATNSTTVENITDGAIDFEYDATESGTLAAFDAAEAKATIEFALAKSPDGTALAASNAGIASYTFYAELNTYAGWKDHDLDVEGTYTLIALKASDVPTDVVGLNVLPTGSAAPEAPVTPSSAGFYTPGGAATTNTASIPVSFPNSSPVTIDFWFNGAVTGATVTQWNGNAPSAGALAAVHFNYGLNTITVDANVISTSQRTLTFTFNAQTYTATLG